MTVPSLVEVQLEVFKLKVNNNRDVDTHDLQQNNEDIGFSSSKNLAACQPGQLSLMSVRAFRLLLSQTRPSLAYVHPGHQRVVVAEAGMGKRKRASFYAVRKVIVCAHWSLSRRKWAICAKYDYMAIMDTEEGT